MPCRHHVDRTDLLPFPNWPPDFGRLAGFFRYTYFGRLVLSTWSSPTSSSQTCLEDLQHGYRTSQWNLELWCLTDMMLAQSWSPIGLSPWTTALINIHRVNSDLKIPDLTWELPRTGARFRSLSGRFPVHSSGDRAIEDGVQKQWQGQSSFQFRISCTLDRPRILGYIMIHPLQQLKIVLLCSHGWGTQLESLGATISMQSGLTPSMNMTEQHVLWTCQRGGSISVHRDLRVVLVSKLKAEFGRNNSQTKPRCPNMTLEEAEIGYRFDSGISERTLYIEVVDFQLWR